MKSLEQQLGEYYNTSAAYRDVMLSHDEAYFASYVALLRHTIAPQGTLLDVGCHYGLSTFLIASEFANVDCVGADISKEAIAIAGTRFIRKNLKYEVRDIRSLPYADATFDVCTAADCLEHVPDLQLALAELMRIVTPGGLLIVKGPNHLSPLTTLIDTVCLRHRYPFTRSWTQNFSRLVFEVRHLARGLAGQVAFPARVPDLTDAMNVGDDADAVNEMSNLYVRNFLASRGWIVERLSWPRRLSRAGHALARLAPSLGSMGLVARKPA